MKKAYKRPLTITVKIAAMQLMQTASMGKNGNYDDGSGITLGARKDKSWSENAFWDDEE